MDLYPSLHSMDLYFSLRRYSDFFVDFCICCSSRIRSFCFPWQLFGGSVCQCIVQEFCTIQPGLPHNRPSLIFLPDYIINHYFPLMEEDTLSVSFCTATISPLYNDHDLCAQGHTFAFYSRTVFSRHPPVLYNVWLFLLHAHICCKQCITILAHSLTHSFTWASLGFD